jgi:hypothetical protein
MPGKSVSKMMSRQGSRDAASFTASMYRHFVVHHPNSPLFLLVLTYVLYMFCYSGTFGFGIFSNACAFR